MTGPPGILTTALCRARPAMYLYHLLCIPWNVSYCSLESPSVVYFCITCTEKATRFGQLFRRSEVPQYLGQHFPSSSWSSQTRLCTFGNVTNPCITFTIRPEIQLNIKTCDSARSHESNQLHSHTHPTKPKPRDSSGLDLGCWIDFPHLVTPQA